MKIQTAWVIKETLHEEFNLVFLDWCLMFLEKANFNTLQRNAYFS